LQSTKQGTGREKKRKKRENPMQLGESLGRELGEKNSTCAEDASEDFQEKGREGKIEIREKNRWEFDEIQKMSDPFKESHFKLGGARAARGFRGNGTDMDAQRLAYFRFQEIGEG